MVNNKNCASCYDFNIDKVVKSVENLKPEWLRENDYVSDFISKNINFSIRTPSKYDVVITLNLGKKFINHKILYWAADAKDSMSPLVLDAKKAYNKFENSGITKINKNGDVTFKIMCPQPYRVKQNKNSKMRTFFRHLHFVVADNDELTWLDQIYTKIIVCKLNFYKALPIIKSNLHVLINALPCEYYAKDHIPNSFNLNYKMIKKMTHNDLVIWFTDVVKIHYPKLYSYIKNKKIEVYEIPLLFYCAHSKCDASQKAVYEIMKKGFVNVQEYSGGIVEYRKHISSD